jgi:cytoskeletal protein CcmA (bactofilin family)
MRSDLRTMRSNMWNRRNEVETATPEPRKLNPTPPPVVNGAPHATPASAAAPAAAPAPAPAPALIGAELSIIGEVKTEQDLNVAGKVQGPVQCSDAALCVLADGHVKGNVQAREVILYGTIEGDVSAKTRLIVRQDGKLIGNVSCAAIMIEETAYFKGSIDIVRAKNGH